MVAVAGRPAPIADADNATIGLGRHPPGGQERQLSRARPTAKELDALIEEVTVDAYNDSEQLTAFLTAFDEVTEFPCPGTVIGEVVEVLSLTTDEDRVELVATCRRAGRRYKVALHEVDLRSGTEVLQLFAAYKRWLRPRS